MPSQLSTTSTILDADCSAGVSPNYSTTQCFQNIYSDSFKGSPVSIRSSQVDYRPNIKYRVIRLQATHGDIASEYFRVYKKRSVFSKVNTIIDTIQNDKIKGFSRQLSNLLAISIEKQGKIANLLPIYGFIADDGSFLMEWIYDNFRVGFSISETTTESSWYIVSKPNAGGINASGYLHGIDLNFLVTWIINFITSAVSE